MTDHTPETSEESFARFIEQVQPGHECFSHEGQPCEHDSGMYFMVLKDPDDPAENAYLSRYHTHDMEVGLVIQAVIDFVDTLFQANRGDAPAIVAHTRGRDLLRHAVESVPPPPAVSQELVGFMDEHIDAWRGLTGE